MTKESKFIPVVSIVGESDTGKTTLIEKIIPELIKRGYRVGTIKHDVHGFEMDHEGKDSWRHKRAGACTVVLSSPWQVAVVEDVKEDHDITELREKYIRDLDIILTEGYKRNRYPKIEVFPADRKGDLISRGDENLLAVVGDKPPQINVPCFGSSDIIGIANLIENSFLRCDELPSTTIGRFLPAGIDAIMSR